MSGYLTTHVLDTARGCPAAGLEIALYRVGEAGLEHIRTVTTNSDGRTDGPILPEAEFSTGTYELVFNAAGYIGSAEFLGAIPIRFNMSEAVHYHVPLLLSPYGYSTYRGS